MHPLIQEQIRTINQYLEELGEALETHQDLIQKRGEEKEELQREQWRQRKHEVTISHITEDLDGARQQVELYQTERTEVHATLQNLLSALKGLRTSMTGSSPS